VCTAAELHLRRVVLRSARPVARVVVLQEASGRAAAPLAVDERALAAIPLPDLALHRRGNVPRAPRRRPRLARPLARSRLPGQRPPEQELERARDDDRRIAIRNLMRQQILQLAKRRVRLLVDRHADLVSPWRQRRDHRRRPRLAVDAPRGVHFLCTVELRHGSRGLGSPSRQRHHARRNVRPGRDLGDQPLDRSLAQVPGPPEELHVVLFRQVRTEEVQPAQMDIAPRDHRECERKPPRRSRSRDPLPRRRLRHVQPLDAVREQRPGRLAQVQPAPLHFRQTRQEVGREPARPRHQHLHSLEHSIIGHRFKTSWFHPLPLARTSQALGPRAHVRSHPRSGVSRPFSPLDLQTPLTNELRHPTSRSTARPRRRTANLSTLGLLPSS